MNMLRRWRKKKGTNHAGTYTIGLLNTEKQSVKASDACTRKRVSTHDLVVEPRLQRFEV